MMEREIRMSHKINLISIITATYNAESCLENLIKSIIYQKTSEVELIIIDGGSNDRTIEIVKKYESNISYWISEPDQGIYDAWNKGVKAAQGEFIMFLGADDMLLPGALNAYLSFLDKKGSNFDIISSKLDYVNDRGVHIRFVGEPWNWNKFKLNRMSFAHPGMLHNSRMLIKYGPFDNSFKICGDFEFLIRTHGNIVTGYIDFVTIKMQQGGISYSVKALIEAYQIRKKTQTLSIIKNRTIFIVLLIRFYLSKIKSRIMALTQE